MTEPSTDKRISAPAVARNREPLRDVLRHVFPARGDVLEIACGTGEHAVFFAAAFPGLRWTPTDYNRQSLVSATAWIDHSELINVNSPQVLDVTAPHWPIDRADAMLCANMIHISPWEVTQGLMAGAGRVLVPGGVLVCYGPYRRNGAHTAPSNKSFDQWLKDQDPRWGVRDLQEVADVAAQNGLVLDQVIEMPANNLSVVYRKA